MAANQSFFTNWTQYLGVRLATSLIGCFSIEENLHTAGVVGGLVHRFNRTRRGRIETHLAQSFPDWPRERIKRTALLSMQHMFRLFMVESMITPRLITAASWPQYVKLTEVRPLLDLLVRGKPAIFITGHMGNWELLGCALAAIGYPMTALARPLDNPLLNDWLLGIREARGLRIITKWGATPVLQETLETGGRLGFIADQNAGDGGLFVPFFGRLASSYKSIALLAMRYEAPVITGTAIRLGDEFRYELRPVDIMTPDDWADQPDPLYYITSRYNRAMEAAIRLAPEQYLWLHRRWKSRPKWERDGKPMPAWAIRKLEQLPWMTQQEMNRIRGEGV